MEPLDLCPTCGSADPEVCCWVPDRSLPHGAHLYGLEPSPCCPDEWHHGRKSPDRLLRALRIAIEEKQDR